MFAGGTWSQTPSAPPTVAGTRSRAGTGSASTTIFPLALRRDPNRRDLGGEVAGFVRRVRAAMRLVGELVLHGARHAELGRDARGSARPSLRRSSSRATRRGPSRRPARRRRSDTRSARSAADTARSTSTPSRRRRRRRGRRRRSARAAYATASIPEAQTLLTVSAVVVLARPALKAAWRAGAWPAPACSTWPMMTCSISAGSMPARATALRIASPPSVVAASEASAPPSRPNGVRAVARTTVRHGPVTFRTSKSAPSADLGADDALVVVAGFALELDVTCAIPNSSCIAAVMRLRIAVASLSRRSSSTTCAESACEPEPIVQTCRSCTATTPSHAPNALAHQRQARVVRAPTRAARASPRARR